MVNIFWLSCQKNWIKIAKGRAQEGEVEGGFEKKQKNENFFHKLFFSRETAIKKANMSRQPT